MPPLRIQIALFVTTLATGCITPPPSPPGLAKGEIIRKLPQGLPDAANWAEDILTAFGRIDQVPTAGSVCAVIAVIEQESNFHADPVVANLPKIVREQLEHKFAKLGPLAGPAVAAVLATKAPGTAETFAHRIEKLRTERDLDLLYRDIEAEFRGRFPGSMTLASAVSKALGHGWLDDLNPVTTAGSMQVKVAYARELDGFGGLSDAAVRDLLYTRAGGVYAGTSRLFDYEASYDDMIYRFADYNAGIYASRNAAFQTLLTGLTGTKLTPDGDLLAYGPGGDIKDQETQSLKALLAAAPDVSEWRVRWGARKEKSLAFEDTAVWAAVRAAWTSKTGKKPPYARLPEISLTSPKLAHKRSTAWFARSVKRRYDACLAKSTRP